MGQNPRPACVVRLDEPLTATGLVHGQRDQRTGTCLALEEVGYVGPEWEPSGMVNVELCTNGARRTPAASRQSRAIVRGGTGQGSRTGQLRVTIPVGTTLAVMSEA